MMTPMIPLIANLLILIAGNVQISCLIKNYNMYYYNKYFLYIMTIIINTFSFKLHFTIHFFCSHTAKSPLLLLRKIVDLTS